MFKVNNKDTRTTPLAFRPWSSVSIVNFGQVNTDWDRTLFFIKKPQNYNDKQTIKYLIEVRNYRVQ